MRRSLTVVPTECFVWSPDWGKFHTEISDTPLNNQGTPFAFMMKSARTGRLIAVRLEHTHRDGSPDNEITHWTYTPVDPTLKFKVELFND